MAISDAEILDAALAFAGVNGVEADPDALVEDAFLLSLAFPRRDDYLSAVANTQRALRQIAEDKVTPAQLKYEHEGWSSYHYQHKVGQGQRADMRIVFRRDGDRLRLRAFGHRSMPKDFYARIAASR